MAGKASIGYLGMGIMGRGMAQNLVKAGYDVTVWNRTMEKCEPVTDMGATHAANIEDAVKGKDAVFFCLAHDAAVEAVVFGNDGLLANAEPDQVIADMSTVYPALSRREAVAFNAKGAHFLDAPVFGSRNEAAEGKLWIVAGGEQEALEQVRPPFEAMSQSVHYMGDNGKGTSMKLVGNHIVALMLESLAEGMTLAAKAGVDLDEMLAVLGETDFASPLFEGVGKTVLERNFDTNFALKLMLKDANLIAQLGEETQTPLPAAGATREYLKAAVNRGWGEENVSALFKLHEQLADVQLKK